MSAEPIWIECEGGGCPPNMLLSKCYGLCAMCGLQVALGIDGGEAFVIRHQRQDLLAMIERGDFDG